MQSGKEENQTISICSWHDLLPKRHKKFHEKIPTQHK
jgi:hypothetical protein